LNHEPKRKEEVSGEKVLSSNSTKSKEIKRCVPAFSLGTGKISSLWWWRGGDKDLKERRNNLKKKG
jgi:hypothetical protein